MKKLYVLFLSVGLGLTLAMPAMPQEQTPTAETPFDRVMEIQDFFKNPDNLVKIQFPGSETLYAWQHMSQFYPTARVARAGNISTLETKINDAIGDVKFMGADGKTRTVSRHFETRPMDAMIVVRQGKIVYERYKTMTPETTHNWFSSGKVISATLLAMLESEGKVDLSKPVSHYLPQLKGSVWDTVPVRHAADMQTGLNGTEHDEPGQDSRTNPEQIWFRWAGTVGILPPQAEKDPFEVLSKMERRRPGGKVFEYNSINTFILARIVEAVENRPIADVFSDRIWSEIGAEHDAYIVMAPDGYALPFGFTSSTLRDFARFGMIYTPSARMLSKTPPLPVEVVKRMQAGGSPDAYGGNFVGDVMIKRFPDEAGKLKNAYMWDAIMSNGDMFKGGVGGQGLYVSPSRDVVVAYFTTGDGNGFNEAMAHAIAKSFDR